MTLFLTDPNIEQILLFLILSNFCQKINILTGLSTAATPSFFFLFAIVYLRTEAPMARINCINPAFEPDSAKLD